MNIYDYEDIDPRFFKSMQFMLNNNIEGVVMSNMSIREKDAEGNWKEIELIEGGKDIPLTESNKKVFVSKIC